MPKRASTSATAADNKMDVDGGGGNDSGEDAAAQSDPNSATPPTGDGGGKWRKGDRVLCTQGTGELYYEAKIVDLITTGEGKSRYTIHYQGWHKRYDETLDDEAAKTRLKVWTEEEAAKAKDAVREAQSVGKKVKVKKSLDAVKHQGSSRGSTPSAASASTASAAKRPRHSLGAQQTPGQQRSGGSKEARKITLPEPLRLILVDDNHFINTNGYLPKVPAKVTVEQIVDRYIKSLGADREDQGFKFLYSTEPNEMITPTAETCEQSALGLLDYFNTTIGSMLLYKFERPLYAELLTNADTTSKGEGDGAGNGSGGGLKTAGGKVRLSNQFGLVHFLRLFVRLGEMLTYTQWSARALDTIMRHAQDFVAFLNAKKDDFYNVDDYYYVAPPDYQKQAYVGGAQ